MCICEGLMDSYLYFLLRFQGYFLNEESHGFTSNKTNITILRDCKRNSK